jgi:hypothetical protein
MNLNNVAWSDPTGFSAGVQDIRAAPGLLPETFHSLFFEKGVYYNRKSAIYQAPKLSYGRREPK